MDIDVDNEAELDGEGEGVGSASSIGGGMEEGACLEEEGEGVEVPGDDVTMHVDEEAVGVGVAAGEPAWAQIMVFQAKVVSFSKEDN